MRRRSEMGREKRVTPEFGEYQRRKKFYPPNSGRYTSSRPGSYRLKDMDDNDIPRSWNVDELWRYYV
jgi:hypothetical protein